MISEIHTHDGGPFHGFTHIATFVETAPNAARTFPLKGGGFARYVRTGEVRPSTWGGAGSTLHVFAFVDVVQDGDASMPEGPSGQLELFGDAV